MGLTSVFVGLISLVNDALFAYIISEDGLNSNFHPVDVSTLNFPSTDTLTEFTRLDSQLLVV